MLRGAGTRFVARLAIGAAAGFKHIAWPRIQSAAQGRRGATAALVAVSASVLLGMAALAMEGGDIYLNRLNAQTSADAAAMAAASAYQYRGRSAALAAAVEVAGRNGFTAAMVTVNNPPTSGSATGNTNAFEVLINKPVPVSLSTAFLGAASVMASRRSVAGLQLNSRACILATSGSVTVQNSSSFNAANCYVGSNLPGVGVNIPQSNNQVVAQGITAGRAVTMLRTLIVPQAHPCSRFLRASWFLCVTRAPWAALTWTCCPRQTRSRCALRTAWWQCTCTLRPALRACAPVTWWRAATCSRRAATQASPRARICTCR